MPIADQDPTGGKLVNPAQDESKGTSLVTPDQSGGQGASNTGNTDGPISTGGSSTTTPVAEQNPDDLAYLSGDGAKFSDQGKLDDHFKRHGSDFGAKDESEYQAQADKFLTGSMPAGTLEKTRQNGDIVRYNPSTDEFGVISKGGSIRTYYKPDPAVHGKGSNLDYFNAQ